MTFFRLELLADLAPEYLINCNSDFRITPHKHIISWGDVNSVSRFFYRNAILVFLASLCDEITKDKKVIIKGYKYILMEIGGETLKDEYSLIYYNLFQSAVELL